MRTPGGQPGGARNQLANDITDLPVFRKLPLPFGNKKRPGCFPNIFGVAIGGTWPRSIAIATELTGDYVEVMCDACRDL